jgi:hypothetical protein
MTSVRFDSDLSERWATICKSLLEVDAKKSMSSGRIFEINVGWHGYFRIVIAGKLKLQERLSRFSPAQL